MATMYSKDTSMKRTGTGSFSLVTMCASSEGGASLAGSGTWALVAASPMTIYTSFLQGTSITGETNNKKASFTNIDMGIFADLELARQNVTGDGREVFAEDGNSITIYDGQESANGYYVDIVTYGTKYYNGSTNVRVITAIHGFIGGEGAMDTANATETTNNFEVVPVQASENIVIPVTAIEPDAVTTAAALTILAGNASVQVIQVCS